MKNKILIFLACIGTAFFIFFIFKIYSSYQEYHFEYNNQDKRFDPIVLNFPKQFIPLCIYGLYSNNSQVLKENISSSISMKDIFGHEILWKKDFEPQENEIAVVNFMDCGKENSFTFTVLNEEKLKNADVYIKRKIIAEYEYGNALSYILGVIIFIFFLIVILLFFISHFRSMKGWKNILFWGIFFLSGLLFSTIMYWLLGV